MRYHQVFPIHDTASEVLVEVVVVEDATNGFKRPANGASSPVLPFGTSTVSFNLVKTDDQDSTAGIFKMKNSKSLLSSLFPARAPKVSADRKLFRQNYSIPGQKSTRDLSPVRRCISSGGAGSSCGSAAESNGEGKLSRQYDVCKHVASANASAVGNVSAAENASNSTFIDALQCVTQAASTTANALSTARQQHEEALQRQREQFRIMMESMRARSKATTLSPEAAAATQSSSSSISEGYPQRTAADAMSPSPCKPLQTQPSVPTSVLETYRGVQFSIPLGCRIEEGEGPSEVRVTGSGLHVTLELRDEGRRVLLISSDCVCTIRRMSGRMYVNVLPRLA